MNKHLIALAGLAAAGLLAFQPALRAQSANRLAASDNTFANKAAQGGMAEVKLGQLAETHASSSDVKAFAKMMIDDHTKANDELKGVAEKKNITLPSDIDAKDQATYDRLAKLNGADFDRAYMRDMVTDHRADVNEFKRESERGADPDFKSFAGKTLPTLQHHLSEAERVDGMVKK